jgi:small subunit ribosomal protein S2
VGYDNLPFHRPELIFAFLVFFTAGSVLNGWTNRFHHVRIPALPPQAGKFVPQRALYHTSPDLNGRAANGDFSFTAVPGWKEGDGGITQRRIIMPVVSMKELLESGVHFGHRTHKWHPKMKPYIFTERNSIHIIDLQKTVKALEEAYDLVRDTVAQGGTVLFVGTKRQAQDTIELEANRSGMPYVTARWLGGTLTNWRTIRQRINELERLERMRDRGDFASFTKKEALGMTRKIERLEMLLGGIRNMTKVPEMLFVVDIRREDTSIHEANLLEIPVVAMVDTNCDPRNIDYIVPSNDDAIRAIKLIVGKIADAVLEGQAMRKDMEEEVPERFADFAVDEGELSDEDLLGAATLAKLQTQREDEAEEAEDTGEEEAVTAQADDETQAEVEVATEEEVEPEPEDDEPESEPEAEAEEPATEEETDEETTEEDEE